MTPRSVSSERKWCGSKNTAIKGRTTKRTCLQIPSFRRLLFDSYLLMYCGGSQGLGIVIQTTFEVEEWKCAFDSSIISGPLSCFSYLFFTDLHLRVYINSEPSHCWDNEQEWQICWEIGSRKTILKLCQEVWNGGGPSFDARSREDF